MRLIELQPRWFKPGTFVEDWKIGITFLCPKCRNHRLGVVFRVPVSPNPMNEMESNSWSNMLKFGYKDRVWDRVGVTFDTLTLTPSMDWSRFGCWHGNITNGEGITC